MSEKKKITNCEQYYLDKSKLDSNDRKQIEWLLEFEVEAN